MGVTTTKTNKPLNPRGNDQSPLAYNRAKLYSGKALDFDGVNDNIVASSFSGLSGEAKASISLYFNFDSINSSENWLIGQDNPTNRVFAFGYKGSTNEIRLQVNGTNTSGLDTFVLTAGEWYHYLFTFDTTTNAVVVYVNGQQVATGTQTKDLISATSDLYIGQREYASAEGRVNGKITNTKIFNEVLTAAQVSDLYNNPEKVVPTGVDNTALKLWLPMMEGAGTTAYDGSGNGNHGTISGATYVNGVGAPSPQSAVMDWNKGSNLFAQSNDFSQSAWNLKNGTFTQGVSDPIGGSQAWSWTATDTDPYIYQQFSVSGTHTMSIYAKGVGSTIGKNFEIRVAQTTQSFVLTSEWQRFELDGSPSNTNLGFEYGNPAVVGDVVYIFGAQFEQATTAGPYVPTFATNQPTPVLLPQGLTSGRDITGVNLFENVRKQGALNLDGNSWAEVHDNASVDITDAISLEMWIYWEDQSAEKTILGKWLSGTNRAYALIAATTTGEIDFRQRVSSSTYSLDISTLSSGWNHVVATHDHSANERIGYINGVQVSTSSSQGVSNESDNDITIGGHSVAQYTQPIAQPRIYNRALTAEEVQRNYNAGKNTYTN